MWQAVGTAGAHRAAVQRSVPYHTGRLEHTALFLILGMDLMDLLEQKFCRDSNLRVKLMYESVK